MAESVIKFKLFEEHPELCYGISSREHGSMRVDDIVGPKNRKLFFRESCVQPENVYEARLVHGNHIVRASHKDIGRETHHTDGLVMITNMFDTVKR